MLKNESGRSMVEMLGVLAIIGVLSVGGIAGYTMAMRKYRANEIVNGISMMMVYCTANDCTTSTNYTTAYSTTKAPGGATALSGQTTSGKTTITATAGDDSVAEEARKILTANGLFTVGGTGTSVTATEQ